jgi:hypothetical protein
MTTTQSSFKLVKFGTMGAIHALFGMAKLMHALKWHASDKMSHTVRRPRTQSLTLPIVMFGLMAATIVLLMEQTWLARKCIVKLRKLLIVSKNLKRRSFQRRLPHSLQIAPNGGMVATVAESQLACFKIALRGHVSKIN